MSSDLGHLLRDLAPQVLGALSRRHGDFAAAEDALQEALVAADAQWPESGVPGNPRGWLYRVALRRMADHLRSEAAREEREQAVVAEFAFLPAADADVSPEEDDSLLLLFMCCHPSLSPASAIALTLRAVGGLTTAEIAGAFLVPEATMAQRISRAKQTIRSSRIPFDMPSERERNARLAAVRHVLYLIFNEGYAATSGAELQRTDLSTEAIRLARMLHETVPDDTESAGLLALMLLTHARRDARSGELGELIPLDEQNRKRWDTGMIAEGTTLVADALRRQEPGPYQLQAAIAALHDEAASTDATDWPQILALYQVLEQMTDNPVVSLNRAIAQAMVDGPRAGLDALGALESDARLRGSHRLIAVRGHLLERLNERGRAIECYRAAAEKTASLPERNYLLMKAARLSSDPNS